MDDLIQGISNYYTWLDSYSKMVLYEYELFMKLFIKYDNLMPSEDIEKCWQYHILITQSYHDFCMAKCKKFIHYNMALNSNCGKDQNLKQKMIIYTYKIYYSEYGPFKYKIPWNNSFGRVIHNKQNHLFVEFKFIKNHKKEKLLPLFNETIGTLKMKIGKIFNINYKYFIFLACPFIKFSRRWSM